MKIEIIKESEIEKKVTKYAVNKGFLQYKFASPSHRGVPDRIFIKNGRVFFIEFKSSIGRLTELQNNTRNKILAQGIKVYVINNIDNGYKVIDENE